MSARDARSGAAIPFGMGLVVAVVALAGGAQVFPEPAVPERATLSPAEADLLKAYQDAMEDPRDDARLQRLLDLLPPSGETDGTEPTYLIEGDLVLPREGVRDYLQGRGSTGWLPMRRVGGIVGKWKMEQRTRSLRERWGDRKMLPDVTSAGVINFWDWKERTFPWAVDEPSFGTGSPAAAMVATVTAAFEEAAGDWERACPECEIHFVRAQPGQEPAILLRYVPLAAYHARSFFPHAPAGERLLRVSRKLFSGEFPPAGILRHEIGHILGYQHEFMGAKNACVRDNYLFPGMGRFRLHGDGEAEPAPDPLSIMQFPCLAPGAYGMQLSRLDIKGHRRLYTWKWQ